IKFLFRLFVNGRKGVSDDSWFRDCQGSGDGFDSRPFRSRFPRRKGNKENPPLGFCRGLLTLKQAKKSALPAGFSALLGSIEIPENGSAFISGLCVMLFAIERINRGIDTLDTLVPGQDWLNERQNLKACVVVTILPPGEEGPKVAS